MAMRHEHRMSMRNDLIVTKLEAAKQDIAQAEEDLKRALREVQVAPRAEKLAISKVLDDAFVKLKAARTQLNDIETLLVERES
jgi:hypothetical protein